MVAKAGAGVAGMVDPEPMVELVQQALDIFLHLDKHLNEWMNVMGPGVYGLLFAIVFAETGLVVTPFLPGDSLLFAAGALSATPGSPLSVAVLVPLLLIAGVAGDAVNYAIGARVGPKVFTRTDSRWLNQKHLHRAQAFYERYGGKTIIFARFVPIVRTFAPFVAGIGKMGYQRFAVFNVVGALAWVGGFTVAGALLGQTDAVRGRFHIIIAAIIVISVMPAVIEYFRERRRVHA